MDATSFGVATCGLRQLGLRFAAVHANRVGGGLLSLAIVSSQAIDDCLRLLDLAGLFPANTGSKSGTDPMRWVWSKARPL